MSQYNFPSGSVLRVLADSDARTETLEGTAVSVRDLEGPMLVIQAAGAGSGTTPALDGKLQDSADGSTGWADLSGAAFTQVTDAAAAAQKITLNATATRGYVRYVGTIAGDTPSFPLGVMLVGMPRRLGA